MNKLYKEMVEKATDFQTEYSGKTPKGVWYPRLKSLVEMTENDIKSNSTKPTGEKTIGTMVDVLNFFSFTLDAREYDVNDISQEQLYFSYIQFKRFGVKWNKIVRNWIPIEQTLQQYCINQNIPLYSVCTDPKNGTVIKQVLTTDLDEALNIDPIRKKNDSLVRWYICNLSFSNIKLFSFHPIEKKWRNLITNEISHRNTSRAC